MTLEQVKQAQAEQGNDQMQFLIESGEVWKFEGSMGRSAMDMLRSGMCFLPEKPCKDYYGNHVPGRNELKPGTTGTLENSIRYYSENEW